MATSTRSPFTAARSRDDSSRHHRRRITRCSTLAGLSFLLLVLSAPAVQSANFRRGDVDGDGVIKIADIQMLAESLGVYGSSPPPCWDALDANDDEVVNISDASAISNHLINGNPLPLPFGSPGPDPIGTALDCQVYNDSMQHVRDDLIIVIDRRSGSKAVSTFEYYGITLKGILDKIIATSPSPSTTALQFYQRWWSLVTGQGSQLATQNPFTGTAATNPNAYLLIAIVNRFDTRPADWSTCGELRVIFGRAGGMNDESRQNRNLIVFDAEVPNPTPGSASGCSCYYSNWNALEFASESTQAYMLQQMLFVSAGGSGSCITAPAVHYNHFRGTLGQIRTNSFIDGGSVEYAYREFKTGVHAQLGLTALQAPVANTIGTGFFNDPIEPALTAFKDYLTEIVPGIISATTFHDLSLGTEEEVSWFQPMTSKANRTPGARVDYFGVSGPNIRNHVAGLIPGGSSITVKNVLDRMNALSCGGCHSSTTIHESGVHPSAGGPTQSSGQLQRNLGGSGGGMLRPTPFTFHHINEHGVMSEGLRNTILPERAADWASLGF